MLAMHSIATRCRGLLPRYACVSRAEGCSLPKLLPLAGIVAAPSLGLDKQWVVVLGRCLPWPSLLGCALLVGLWRMGPWLAWLAGQLTGMARKACD